MLRSILVSVFLGTLILSCSSTYSVDSNTNGKSSIFTDVKENRIPVRLANKTTGEFGDSKLVVVKNEVYVVATLSRTLSLKKFDDSETLFSSTSPEISSDWIGVMEDDNSILCVTASFKDQSLRLYRINTQSLNVEFLTTIITKERLLIDPLIIKVENEYFITFTQIDGNINNGNELKQNGHYEVVLMKSNDLINWDTISTIVSENANIEDGSLLFDKEKKSLFFMYEEEVFDKKKSIVKIRKSIDMGQTWKDPIPLLDGPDDKEPAAIFKYYNNYYIFYSSDLDDIGSSYYGAKGYMSAFDVFNLKPIFINANIYLDKGIVLYDVILNDKNLFFLAKKMITDYEGVLMQYKFPN